MIHLQPHYITPPNPPPSAPTYQACIMLMIAYIEGLNNSWLTNLTWKAFVYATHPQQWYCAVYWIITTVREGCGVLIDCLRLVNRHLLQQWYWIITTVLGVDKLPGSCGKSLVAAVVLHGAQDYNYGERGAWGVGRLLGTALCTGSLPR